MCLCASVKKKRSLCQKKENMWFLSKKRKYVLLSKNKKELLSK